MSYIFNHAEQVLSVIYRLNLITKSVYVDSLTLLINNIFAGRPDSYIASYVRSSALAHPDPGSHHESRII